MGYHATVATDLKTLIVAALPGVPAINIVEEGDTETIKLAQYVAFMRDDIVIEPTEEFDLDEGSPESELETWIWELYVKGGGGGGPSLAARARHVDLMLEALRATLGSASGEVWSPQCSRPQLLRESKLGAHGAGWLYKQIWTFDRWT